MNEVAPVTELIAKLERVLNDIEAISIREDERRKFELVQLRKLLAETIGQLSDAGKKLFSTFPDREIEERFRSKLNRMRNAVALHQTIFPAAALDQRSMQYRKSAMNVGQTNREFIDWAKPTFALLHEKREG
jgi:hypothetical protein